MPFIYEHKIVVKFEIIDGKLVEHVAIGQIIRPLKKNINDK